MVEKSEAPDQKVEVSEVDDEPRRLYRAPRAVLLGRASSLIQSGIGTKEEDSTEYYKMDDPIY